MSVQAWHASAFEADPLVRLAGLVAKVGESVAFALALFALTPRPPHHHLSQQCVDGGVRVAREQKARH